MNDERITIHDIQALNVYMYADNASERFRAQGYLPAFYNRDTLTVELSRFTNGKLAPIHLLDALPSDWVAERSPSGKILALKDSVDVGYLCDGVFYTPCEVSEAVGFDCD